MKTKTLLSCLVGSVFTLIPSVFADTVYTAGGEGWGAALTVAAGETVVLQAADAEESAWEGAVTVQEGGVLKTSGRLNVSGATAVNAGGQLDVTAGEATFNFGSQTIQGDFLIRAGARVNINRTDALNYGGTDTLHIWGTFNCGTYRQSFGANNRLYLYDGAQVLGVGDGEGGFDFYANGGRMVVSGTSTIEPFVKVRTANTTVNLAMCEGANVTFAGGLRGAATFAQVPATAAEGNASETCQSAVVTVGPNNTFTGALNLSSAGANKVVFAAAPTYAIACADGTALTVEATAEVPLPTITTTGSVTVTGEGPTVLPAAVDYSLVAAGALKVTAPTTLANRLTLGTGGSLMLVGATSAGTLLTVTGGIEVADPHATVVLDARANEPGTYNVLTGLASLTACETSVLAPAGGSASLSFADGVVKATVAGSTLDSALTWRPTDAGNLAWSVEAANWQLDDGTASGFINGLATKFDAQEAAKGVVTVDGVFRPGALSIAARGDYTFAGTGALEGSAPVTITGPGTVVLDGVNFGDQDITVTDATLKLGENAGDYALGTTVGKLTIAGRGVLDLNYNKADSTDAPRNRISHRKVIELKDGGTVLNSTSNSTSGILGNIRVVGSGTIAGTARIDVRNTNHDPECTTTSVLGDENAVLNIANSDQMIGLNSAEINIGRINVKNGGWLRKEATGGTEIIPGGIHIENGGYLGYWNSKTDAGVTVFVDDGIGELGGESATSYLRGPLVIAEGATARSRGGATLDIDGGIQNNGVFESNAGTIRVRSEMSDNFALKMTAGTFNIEANGHGGVLNAEATGGSLAFSHYSGNNAEKMANFTEVNFNRTGGNLDILPQVAGFVDTAATFNITSAASAGPMYVYGPTNTAEYGAKMLIKGSLARVSVGVNNHRAGALELKEGTELETQYFYTGDNGTSPAQGRIIVDAGASVKVLATDIGVRNGHWSGTPQRTANHTMDIAGTVDAATTMTYNPYDAPRAYMVVREGGEYKTKGFSTRVKYAYEDGGAPSSGRMHFKLDGGRLELGDSGLIGGNRVPGVERYDFAAGEFVSTAAWGMDQGTIAFFGHDDLGRAVTFDLGENLVNWNTGLSGASAVTLKGNANFQGTRAVDHVQGALLGKFTVENTGANDLTIGGFFADGLELAEGTTASVAKFGDTDWSFTVGGNHLDMTANSVWPYPYASATPWDVIHRHYAANPRASETGYALRGEFYVAEDQAGPWSFAGNYDDNIRLDVDGTQVFKTTGWQNAEVGTVQLTAGWHAFTIAVYDGTGGMGPGQVTWSDGKAIGFLVGESTSTDSANYTKFSPENLQMRPYVNAMIWSYQNGNGDWETTENWSQIKPQRTTEVMFKNSGASDASEWAPWFSGKANRFAGWFKVDKDQVGDWTFNMGYDDNKILDIDGKRVVNTSAWNVTTTGKAKLDAGWHRWEVRVQDGSGGWGPSAANNGNTLSFIAPGAAEQPWTENNLTLAATLGDIQVLEGTKLAGTVKVNAGATLASTGTQAMPLTGTLTGAGALTGAFAFTGEDACWAVAGSGNKVALEGKTAFESTGKALFDGLKTIRVTFDQKPVCSSYTLAAAGDFTAAEAEKIAVTAAVLAPVSTDYTNAFKATVRNGELVLLNTKPGGLAIFLR